VKRATRDGHARYCQVSRGAKAKAAKLLLAEQDIERDFMVVTNSRQAPNWSQEVSLGEIAGPVDSGPLKSGTLAGKKRCSGQCDDGLAGCTNIRSATNVLRVENRQVDMGAVKQERCERGTVEQNETLRAEIAANSACPEIGDPRGSGGTFVRSLSLVSRVLAARRGSGTSWDWSFRMRLGYKSSRTLREP